jgi:hypothetical protein
LSGSLWRPQESTGEHRRAQESTGEQEKKTDPEEPYRHSKGPLSKMAGSPPLMGIITTKKNSENLNKFLFFNYNF